jgi:hypothetical protein
MEDMIAEMMAKSNGVTPESVPEQVDTPAPEVIETPITEPETQPTTEPVTGQWYEQFGFNSEDEAKSVFDKAKSFKPEEVEGYKTKANQLAEELERVRTTSPYKNLDYARLEKIEEERPDEFGVFKKLILGEPSKEELIKLDIIKKNPILKDKPDTVQRKFERMFPGLFEFEKVKQEYDVDTPEYRKAEQDYKDSVDDIELESETIKQGLLKEFRAIEVKEPPKVDTEALAKFETGWKDELSRQLDNPGKLSIEVLTEDKKGKELLMEVEPKETKKYLEQAMQFVKAQRLELKKESVEAVKDLAKKLWILDHIEEYNTQIAEHVGKTVAKDKDKAWRTKVHNPSPVQGNKPVTAGTDPQKELFEQINRDLTKR